VGHINSSMKTILLTWNPRRWHWHDLDAAVAQVANNGSMIGRWSCGNTRSIQIGDRAFLMRLGEYPKGIVGSGWVISAPVEMKHWDDSQAEAGKTALFVEGAFDVLSYEPLVRESELFNPPFDSMNWFPQASGVQIPSQVATALEVLWHKRAQGELAENEIATAELFLEGRPRQFVLNHYERNRAARQACINHYGPRCVCCDCEFGLRYGPAADGLIHVHHLTPISELGESYVVDPVNDLRPVCPNCHGIIHSNSPPYSIEAVREMVQNCGR
jgi:5-methylcytosine-specific restriction protein A